MAKKKRNVKACPNKCYLTNTIPLELREQIYGYVLPSPGDIQPNVSSLFSAAEQRERSGAHVPRYERVLGLARTCKSISSEVLAVYYGQNTFWFRDAYELYRYLYMIGDERRGYIKNLRFPLTGVNNWEFQSKTMYIEEVFELAFEMLGDCVNLRSLWLAVNNETTERTRPKTNLFAVKKRGFFDTIRGLDLLKLKVREINDGYATLENRKRPFELGFVEAQKLLPWTPLFKASHLEEFEKALQVEFMSERGAGVCVEEMMVAKEGGKPSRLGKKRKTAATKKRAAEVKAPAKLKKTGGRAMNKNQMKKDE